MDRFVRGGDSKKEPEPLAVISSCLHSDPRLNEDAAAALDQMVKAAYRSMRKAGDDSMSRSHKAAAREKPVSALNISSFIWGIADDVLRDVYVRGKYRDVILPMTVIRRLDAVLEPTKDDGTPHEGPVGCRRHNEPGTCPAPSVRRSLLQHLALPAP